MTRQADSIETKNNIVNLPSEKLSPTEKEKKQRESVSGREKRSKKSARKIFPRRYSSTMTEKTLAKSYSPKSPKSPTTIQEEPS